MNENVNKMYIKICIRCLMKLLYKIKLSQIFFLICVYKHKNLFVSVSWYFGFF